jgi:A49-like RNA polymerase I associated factor
MEYTGIEDISQKSLGHYVGIFDPQSNKLRVVEIRRLVVTSISKARLQDLKEKESKKEEEDEKKMVSRHMQLSAGDRTDSAPHRRVWK